MLFTTTFMNLLNALVVSEHLHVLDAGNFPFILPPVMQLRLVVQMPL